MRARGFLEQRGADGDRRMKDLVLTTRGRALMRAATEIGGRVEARLRREIGAAAVDGMRTALEHLLVSGGAETEMRARRSRPVW
jgi:DNA-binding MarR family transcriptional regulator